MENIQRDIHYLPYEALTNLSYLDAIYADTECNYYWSDDYSAAYYIAQAKAGFICVTEVYKGQELLLPEIQFEYALLDLAQLHCSKKVAKLIRKENLQLTIDNNIEEIAEYIDKAHKRTWLTKQYAHILRSTEGVDEDFKVITAYVEHHGEVVAGEIGYMIGKTYTSLSGFCKKDKKHNNYGTAQLVLLGRHLKENGFTLWSLGHDMSYKRALGAEICERERFLERWFGV
jgi:Leu/Phe-tRNA-protein transferase